MGFGTFPVRTHIMTNFPSLRMPSLLQDASHISTLQTIKDASWVNLHNNNKNPIIRHRIICQILLTDMVASRYVWKV